MSKVAIATMTGGANFGNALQNYAVYKLIEDCGYEAETLNITTQNGYPDFVFDDKSLFQKLAPTYVSSWLEGKLYDKCGAKNSEHFKLSNIKKLNTNAPAWKEAEAQKQEKFAKFQKDVLKYTDFEVSNKDFNLENLEQYSAFVTGSDQVWNPHYLTNSVVEFLQMAPKEKRIAFIPSFGVSSIPECIKKDYSKWISEIPYLSVREEAGSKIIKELTGRESKVLLDPTFGLTKKEWIEFSRKPKDFDINPYTYVFCYFLGKKTRKYNKFIKKYASKNNCKIVDVFDVLQLENYSYDPCEFVWLLSNSHAVFTDSFHGCAFSINMNKPFVVFDRAGDGCITQSSRIETVLNKVKLQNRKFENVFFDDIDDLSFEYSNKVIEDERKAIFDYLKNSLDKSSSNSTSPLLATKRHCTGCGACVNACPKGAVSMVQDNDGFLYPSIVFDKCINCKLCEKSCPADKVIEKEEVTKAFYAFSKDEDTCKNSSSGGVFSELAKTVIDVGGIVFGAGYDKDFKVCHTSCETLTELTNIRTSKYVQSDTSGIFSKVKEQLGKDRLVLFSGTPCQIVALNKFLGKEYFNLILVDIICHGVPSPAIWDKYLNEEHREKGIKSISFRNKDVGWNDFSMKIEYNDGSYYRELAVKDPFEKAFLANVSLRPSCYQCQYKTIARVSDITIADYWGVEVVHPELKDKQGVSLVLIHSQKGEKIFGELNNIIFGETDLVKSTTMNHATTHSVAWPKNRNKFFELQKTMTVKDATEECLKLTTKQKIRRFIITNGSRVKGFLRHLDIIW